VAELPIPGAHGAGLRVNGRTLSTTNLPGGGTDALWTIDRRSNIVVGNPVDAPYGVPHNLALAPHGGWIDLNHLGGTGDKVTVYRAEGRSRVPTYVTEITVGSNPFGLAYVP
jgi:hypothetical protein